MTSLTFKIAETSNRFAVVESGPPGADGNAGDGATFADNEFRVQDNADATKQIALEASGITTGTTRTITMPDTDVDLADVANAYTVGGTDVAVADGGTGASTAAGARTNLGLGTAATSATGDFEAAGAVSTHSADTTSVHGIADTSALLDTADIGVSVQAYSAALDNVSGTNTGDEVAATDTVAGIVELATIAEVDTGTDTQRAITPAALAGSALQSKVDGIEANADVTDTANVTAAGALMDSEVDADIKTLSLPANTTISTFGASLVDDADASTARSTLGLGTMAVETATDYLTTAAATSTYAPIANPTFTGNVVVPDADAGTEALNRQTADARYATAAQGALADSAVQPGDAQSINAQTGTTYTLVLADAGKLITCNNGSAVTLTVPPNSSVAFPVGTTIEVIGIGAGIVTLAQGAGVTINATPTLVFRAQHSGCTLKKIATDTWQAVGDFASA